MSDIPVGSPPAPPGRHAAPGGWYPDPLDRTRERYWDGWQWSRTTRVSESSVPVALPPASGYQAANGGGPGSAYSPVAPGFRPLPTTADGVPLAGWWWRALASIVDALAVGVVAGLLTLPFYRDLVVAFSTWWSEAYRAAQAGGAMPPQPDFGALASPTDQLLIALITFAVGMAYHVPFLRRRSATPGLLACGLRVVPVDHGRTSAPLSWTCVILRALLWVLPGALGLRILTVADVLVPLWHPKRQTLHDLAAQTQVVRLR